MLEQNKASEQNCRVAKWYTDQDSCQAHDYERCATCGTSEGNGCRLSEETIANLLQQEECKQVTVQRRAANARTLAKEIVRVEREEHDRKFREDYDDKFTKHLAKHNLEIRWWNNVMWLAAIVVIIAYFPDAFRAVGQLLVKMGFLHQ